MVNRGTKLVYVMRTNATYSDASSERKWSKAAIVSN